MKRVTFWLCCFFVQVMFAQEYTLDSCQAWARAHYPLIRQFDLVDKLAEYSVSNAARAYLPQFSLTGSATYQSDIVGFPEQMAELFKMAGVDFEGLHKDQYKFTLNMTQVIWDGGVSGAQRKAAKAERMVSEQQVETELYALRERVNQIYFGILMLKAQLEQNALIDTILKSNLSIVETYVFNGTALESEIARMKAEVVSNMQNRARLESTCSAYLKVLSIMVGHDITSVSMLVKPSFNLLERLPNEMPRPELRLYDAQIEAINAQKKQFNSALMPKFSLFAQGWYGYPGLNMFEDMVGYQWSLNGIVGLQFQWNISAFYTHKNNIKKLEMSQQQINLRREAFVYNNNLQQIQTNESINQMLKVMRDDDEIIALRRQVRQASEAMFENGTITVSDLLKDINNESQALLLKSLHEIELLKNIYELRTLKNIDN